MKMGDLPSKWDIKMGDLNVTNAQKTPAIQCFQYIFQCGISHRNSQSQKSLY